MKNLSKKISSIIMVICFIFNFSTISFTFAKDEGKRAIIIIPGIGASELFSAKDQEIDGTFYPKSHRFFPPECVMPFVDIDEFKGIDAIGGLNIAEIMKDINLIAYNDAGVSRVSMMPTNPVLDCKNNPENRNFGTVDCYKKLVKSLVASVDNNEYDVVFFSYDWRRSNKDTAKDLESLIVEKNYKDVTLIGHSMGTLVCSSYLSNAQNKRKIDKVILLGGPLLGAPKTYSVLDEGRFVDGALGVITSPIVAPILKNVLQNCPAAYELLPPKQYFNIEPDGYLSQSPTSTTKQQTKINSYEDTIQFINKRGISKISNDLLNKAQAFYDSLFANGNFVLEDESVKLYNILGTNQLTPGNIVVNEKAKGVIWTNKELKVDGDGMVSIPSALVGTALSKKNNYYFKGVSHIGLISNKSSIELICNILSNKFEMSAVA